MTGTAMGYLKPQHPSDTDQQRFQTAEEMILLSKPYFVSGNKRTESQAAFHRLFIDKSKALPAFKAGFISAATKGPVAKSEWFFYP
jgi:hypothetical protein